MNHVHLLIFVWLTLKMHYVKAVMTRVNIDILGINKLRWTGMGEFHSDDHYIYYCGQESLRINRVALTVNSQSEMHYLGAISKMISVVSKANHSISQ